MRDQLMSLHAALPKLSSADADFARSLLLQAVNAANGHKGCQPLSTKQLYWVGKLTERATAAKPATATVGDFSAVIAMFAAASKDAKRNPKVRLQLPNGKPIVLSVAGPAARQPGTVNVTDGKPYGSSIWYGRVTPKGEWQKSTMSNGAETDTAITALLTAFAANPLKVAKAYGETTHHCCFCGITLTDKRSKAAGYGPICADKFGLAWG